MCKGSNESIDAPVRTEGVSCAIQATILKPVRGLLVLRNRQLLLAPFALEDVGQPQLMRTAIVLLKPGKAHIIGVQYLELFKARTQHEGHGTLATRPVRDACNQLIIQEPALYVQVDLIGNIPNIPQRHRRDHFEVLAADVNDIAQLENIMGKESAIIPRGLIDRHGIQTGPNGIGHSKVDEHFVVIEDVCAGCRIKKALTICHVFQDAIIRIDNGRIEQIVVDGSVQELCRQTDADFGALQPEAEGVIQLNFGRTQITNPLRKNTTAQREAFPNSAAVHQGVGLGTSREARPSAPRIPDKLMLVVEPGVTWVDQDRIYLVLVIYGYLLSKSDNGN